MSMSPGWHSYCPTSTLRAAIRTHSNRPTNHKQKKQSFSGPAMRGYHYYTSERYLSSLVPCAYPSRLCAPPPSVHAWVLWLRALRARGARARTHPFPVQLCSPARRGTAQRGAAGQGRAGQGSARGCVPTAPLVAPSPPTWVRAAAPSCPEGACSLSWPGFANCLPLQALPCATLSLSLRCPALACAAAVAAVPFNLLL
jgi:hypothetical protein